MKARFSFPIGACLTEGRKESRCYGGSPPVGANVRSSFINLFLLRSFCRSLYEQLSQNRKREEDALAARRKLMYGVRPMDDDEYRDYEQMEIARRERERQRKEKRDYEERQFSRD